ncbi:hypothetical protein PoB_006501400 [Plakobranchus ocellatus]|uniref:Uncharacterized protein n=1 Tax=Plakobranchus ocellatus TaxID=259542 RepID=A0AAV4D2Y7_9GAST|nr:hypothetical protein PoB_006501400 [Plakobranchus ocellatus]
MPVKAPEFSWKQNARESTKTLLKTRCPKRHVLSWRQDAREGTSVLLETICSGKHQSSLGDKMPGKAPGTDVAVTVRYPPTSKPDNLRNKTSLVIRAATVRRIMRGHVMAPPFPLSNRATDARPGCKTQRIVPTLRQVADLVCARTKEREYFETCIVGHVNCCLQCGPTLRLSSQALCSPDFNDEIEPAT